MLIAHLHLSRIYFHSQEYHLACNMNCTPLVWSLTTADALSPTVIVCAIALIAHTIFWIQLLLVPNLQEKSMMWLYGYLATDYILLIRFFILYSLRKEEVCLYPIFRMILCYVEASSKFYINAVQTSVRRDQFFLVTVTSRSRSFDCSHGHGHGSWLP